MTSYKEPRIEIEQQFTATASSTYLPDLRGCIVAPFYDIVEEESVGTYANAEEEYNWASVRPVDVRTGANADEITYPLTVTLKDALTEIKSGETGGGQGTGSDVFAFDDSSGPFTYPMPAGKEMFLKFDSGSYTHTTGEVTIALSTGPVQAFLPYNNVGVGHDIVPADGNGITQDGVTATLVGVYATLGGQKAVPGTTMPATGYLWISGASAPFLAAPLTFDAPSTTTCDATAPQTTLFTLTSVPPTFYPGYDFISEAVTNVVVYKGAVTKLGKVVSDPSSTVMTIYSDDMHGAGPADSVVIDRIALTAVEIALMRRVRSVNSTKQCTMYVAKTGVVYSAVTYDIFERDDYDITIDEFADWDITLTSTGMILPIDMQTPDGYPVTAADVYLTYRALRTDLENELDYYENAAAVTTEFTTVNKYNTGAYMLYMALTQSKGKQIYATGLGEDFYTDVPGAFTSALSFLEDKRVYAVACASMLPAVHTIVNAHVALCSTAEVGAWRIGINSHTMSFYEILHTSLTTGSGYVDIYREGFTGNRFSDANAEFITDGVSAGDCVYITGWTAVEPKEVADVTIVNGLVSVVSPTWGTADTTLSIAAVTLPAGFDVTDFRNRTVMMTYVAPNYDTSTDDGVYSDHTRSDAKISTAQEYSELGYKVISASLDAGALTLHLYTVDANPTVPTTPDAQTMTSLKVYDGPLSLREETAILNSYTEIGSVVSEDMLLATFKSGYTGTYTGVSYQTRDLYDRDELATTYAAYTSSFDTRRMNFTFPHVYQDSDGTQLPGYFISAGEAGWIGGSYPHQPITSQNLQGYYRLMYSNKYFKKSQLNIIAGGGVTIYTQEVDNAGITCRHQLTTDMSSILTQENSTTRSVDTGSYMLLDALNPLKGRYNIVDDLYTVINTKVNAVRALLCEKKYSRYGSILKKYEVVQLIQDPTAQDGLYIEVECETQKPFNRARVLIKVS